MTTLTLDLFLDAPPEAGIAGCHEGEARVLGRVVGVLRRVA